MALSDLQKMVAGMFYPAQPAANASIYDLARADAQRQAMSALGAGLIGAAVPQTPLMRAQALQQAFANVGNMGTNVYNAAQVRLLEQKQKMEAADRAAEAAWNERFESGAMATPIAATVPIPPVEPVGEFRPLPAGAARLIQQTPPTAAPAQGVMPSAAPSAGTPAQSSRLNEFGLTNEQYNWLLTQPPSSRRELTQRLAMQNLNDGGVKYGDPKEVMIDGKRVMARFPETGGEPLIIGEAPPTTPAGIAKYDEAVAKDIRDWELGGRPVAAAQLSNLQFVEDLAKNNPNITGPTVGVVDAAGILKFTNPQAEAAKNTVHQIALTQIRAVAGAQYTAQEAQDFLNRAWNPALPIEENMRRVKLMGETLKVASEEKDRQAAYFFENGTMRGYKQKVGTSTAAMLADFNERIGFNPQTEPMFIDPNSILNQETQQGGQQPVAPSQPTFNPNRWGIQPVIGQQNSGFR